MFSGHIQIAQAPDRHEPDSPGEIDYPGVFSQLQESGYDGWVGLEYSPREGTQEGLAWVRKMGLSL